MTRTGCFRKDQCDFERCMAGFDSLCEFAVLGGDQRGRKYTKARKNSSPSAVARNIVFIPAHNA